MRLDTRVLILAPRGRDAAIASDLLRQNGLVATTCGDLEDLVAGLIDGAGTVLVTEEALASGDRAALADWVLAQPKWSDLPFVVLANGTKAPRTPLAAATLESLGNVLLLERPLHADAMVGALRSALKARRRQYEVRAFADTLEQSVAQRTHELETARESLEFALDAADMGSWDLDLASDVARRTLRHDEIFGYASPQPSWGRDTFLRHVVAEDRDRIAASFDAAIAAGTFDIECRIAAADRSTRWISVKGRVHRDQAGHPVRMTGVVADITARKEADERLAQAAKMDTTARPAMSDDLHIPIIQEDAQVFKRLVDTEHVSVRTTHDEHDVIVHDALRREHVEVSRVPIDREVAEAPAIRVDGDLTIVPVLEERLIVEKRLFLVEEVHVRRTATAESVEVPMTLRRTRVEVDRTDLDPQENQ